MKPAGAGSTHWRVERVDPTQQNSDRSITGEFDFLKRVLASPLVIGHSRGSFWVERHPIYWTASHDPLDRCPVRGGTATAT